VFPADVHLNTKQDWQSIIVQAVYQNGLTEDVTDMAQFALANPAFTHRGAGHPQQRRKFALGGQARTHRELAVVDERADLPGNLPVQPQRLHGMQGHLGITPPSDTDALAASRSVSGHPQAGPLVRDLRRDGRL
jgi:hypothetical protein